MKSIALIGNIQLNLLLFVYKDIDIAVSIWIFLLLLMLSDIWIDNEQAFRWLLVIDTLFHLEGKHAFLVN